MKAGKLGVRSSRVLAVVIGPALALVTQVTPAHADATCISAYEQTQTLRKDGKPVSARAQAAICAKESCPALLMKDCTRWLAELETVIPTVILEARSPSGAARTDVRVTLDGALVAEKIDGKPIALEPGSHTFVLEAGGAASVSRTLVVREGDPGQTLTVTMTPASAERARLERPVPLGTWIFGGASVVALGTSLVFAVDGLSKKSELESCKPRCAASDVDAMTSRFTFADVALGAGLMAGAAAVYLLLTRPTVEAPAAARSTGHTPRPVRAVPYAAPLEGGGVAGLTARF